MEYITGENVAIILFFIGIYGIFSSRRIFKTIVSIGIMEVAIVTFFLTMNSSPSHVAPIGITEGVSADPLPQALMITAIVIGVAVTATALVMFINLYHLYGNSEWNVIHKKRMDL